MAQVLWRKDPQDCVPVGRCFVCGGEIYRGNPVYSMEEGWVCQDCLRVYCAPWLVPAGEEVQE